MPSWIFRPWGNLGRAAAVLLLAAGAGIIVTPVVATEPGPLAGAERAYDAGRYDQVAALTRGDHDPAALALNARALLTKAMLMDGAVPEVGTLAGAAQALADTARHADPDLVESYLEGAIARGLLADRLPLQPAIRNVREARSLIDTALRLAPDDPRALSTDGGWHLMLTGRLGTIAADLLFSASRAHGLEAFQRAFAILGNDPNLLYHFAKVRMLQSDAEALPESRAALRKLGQLHPSDALGRALQRRGPELLAAIDARQARSQGEFGASGRP